MLKVHVCSDLEACISVVAACDVTLKFLWRYCTSKKIFGSTKIQSGWLILHQWVEIKVLLAEIRNLEAGDISPKLHQILPLSGALELDKPLKISMILPITYKKRNKERRSMAKCYLKRQWQEALLMLQSCPKQ